MMDAVKVGVLGLGTVGAGVVNLLARNGDEIARRAGREIRVTRAAVRNLEAPRECATADIDLGTDCHSIVTDPEIDVVCFMSALEYQFVYASRIKEVAKLGGNVQGLVPKLVAAELVAKFKSVLQTRD